LWRHLLTTLESQFMILALAKIVIHSSIVLATVIKIVNYYCTVIKIINYDRKTFIVQATGHSHGNPNFINLMNNLSGFEVNLDLGLHQQIVITSCQKEKTYLSLALKLGFSNQIRTGLKVIKPFTDAIYKCF
jgi:hypothetical protein